MSSKWENIKLKDLAQVIMGQSPRSEYYNTVGEGLPFFQGCKEFGEFHPAVEKHCSQPSRVAQSGDILMSVRAPVGMLNIADRECCIGRGLCSIREKSGTRFVYYLLKANLPLIESYGTGTTYRAVNKDHVINLPFRAPPVPIQRKIAAILSAYDNLIENNLRRIKILEEMAQLIYREWFLNFRFPGHEKVRMVDSELGRIPEGWEVKHLFDAVEVTYGYPFQSRLFSTAPIGKPVVRIRDIPKNYSETFTSEVPQNAKYNVKNGHILVGMDGDFHMGKWAGGDAYLNQRVARFRPVPTEVSQYFVFLALRKPIQHLNASITGTTVCHLGDMHLKKVHLVIPDTRLLSKIKPMFDDLYELETELIIKNTNLRQTGDLLLPKLISGELDVSELDIDVGEEAA